MGWTCCYRKELISGCPNRAFVEVDRIHVKESQRKSQFTLVDSYTNAQLYTFATLQLLDIWTTYKSLQYDCVRELNPIMGESPSVPKMFAVKTLVLIPTVEADIKNERLTRKTMRQVNTMMVMVITNNNTVRNRAKNNCQKYP